MREEADWLTSTMSFAQWHGKTLILQLYVQPGASRDEIVGLHGDRLKVRINAPPVDGRANRHLIEYLAAVFGVARSAITLVRGESGRAKTVKIDSPACLPPQVAAPPAGSP